LAGLEEGDDTTMTQKEETQLVEFGFTALQSKVYLALLRLGSNGLLFYLDIFDRKEMLFGPAITDAELSNAVGRDTDLWTNNLQFVGGMHALFEHLWDASAKYESIQ
jgi:hypothetical protein